jgi:ferric-dicitrate binding protein FerR (iron transport regulator)
MKRFVALTLCFTCLTVVPASRAVDLKQSKVTQVVNDVQIISAADQAKKAAVVNDIFAMPDILRTGAASRAELVAEDDTITRVGANTIFSFDPASRTIDLQQGSLLFHSPHGKGGGTIHTGSATASVLGSTLIVTTTPNGGFKVIALEDGAEIHLHNGLKQKLKPGQMTFILPGGSELAPILVFRLDELIRDSLLVKGFNQPLTSLPLIQNQVDKQIKLITSGRATDTGLLAGNNASSSQVEVLDANTIQSDTYPEQVKAALGADATINQSSLTDASIPTPPPHVFLNPSFMLAGNKFFGNRTFSGFAARNISINTPAANLDSLTVDLSPYAGKFAGKSEFDFVAANNLNIEGSVTFAGLPSSESLYLIAGNQISIAPNISVQADVADFELLAPGALTLNGASLINNAGDIGLTSGSDFTMMNGGSIYAAGTLNIEGDSAGATLSVINAGVSGSEALASDNAASDIVLSGNAGVNIANASITENAGTISVVSSGGNVNVNDTTINADPDAGSVSLTSSSGSVTVSATSIRAGNLTINSGDGILLDGTGATFTGNRAVNLSALNTINVSHGDFSSYGVLAVIAQTVTFVDVNLPLYTIAKTLTGNVEVNGTVTPNWLNLIHCSWMGTPITSTSQISTGAIGAPGVYSSTIR